jgi:SMODS-associating 2TM, beta-strand rich effector domain
MSLRFQIIVWVGLSTAVWALLLLFRGVAVDPHWIGSFGQAVTLVTVIVVATDRYFCYLGPLCRLVPHQPVIHGTWKGWIESSKQKAPIPGFLVITQSLTRVSVSLLTARGRSHTITSRWGKTDLRAPAVHYTFRRFPSKPAGEGQPIIRFGSGVLEISGRPAGKITGPYWTEVQTIGHMEFTRATKKLFTAFDDAVEHLGLPATQPG